MRTALARSRESRRRDRRSTPWDLPDHLGLEIHSGQLPAELPGAARPRKWLYVEENRVLVSFPSGPRLLVEDGSRATVQWDGDENAGDPGWVVQGWAVTLAMLQRGRLSLHASTLDIWGRVVALAGARGAGKSTTALGLRARGHRLLIDDVTLLDFGDAATAGAARHQITVLPYGRAVHLLPESAAAVGMDFAALPLLAGGRQKAAFHPEDPDPQPRPLDHVIVLQPEAGIDRPSAEEVRGSQRIPALMTHAERDGLAPLVLGRERYHRMLLRLAQAVPVTVIRRPVDRWCLDEVLELIERTAAPTEPQQDVVDLREQAADPDVVSLQARAADADMLDLRKAHR